MTFALSSRSLSKLERVQEPLVRVVRLAIQLSKVDFGVTEGVRTLARQEYLFRTGASQTMNSKHMPDASGMCRAVDLAAYLDADGDGDKEFSWHWPHVLSVAEAMRSAAMELRVHVVWGGVWDRALYDLTQDLGEELGDYVMRRRAMGKKSVFQDGPHFQLGL
jgi:peptidoglycan L-alanyl-D-glutamate endopeptidase CwlK